MNKRITHYLTFICLLISTALGWSWLWGALFVFWALPAYFSRQVFFIDMVERDKEPIFYWAILATWVLLGCVMTLSDIPILKAYLAS